MLRVPPAAPADAAAYFAARLAFHTDVADVHAALAGGAPGFVLVDSRGPVGWAQGRLPGAVHLPTAEIPARAPSLLDPAVPVVTYCWGPGCDGATPGRARPGPARLPGQGDARRGRVLDPGGVRRRHRPGPPAAPTRPFDRTGRLARLRLLTGGVRP